MRIELLPVGQGVEVGFDGEGYNAWRVVGEILFQ